MGRSIHEIPRQDLLSQESRKTPEMVQTARPIIEGSISQVNTESTVTLTQDWIRSGCGSFFHSMTLTWTSSPLQGTPIKYESNSGQSAIKHNVKSLITGPSKLPRGMPQLEMVPENVKVVERGKYEDVKTGDAVRSRHTSVVSSGPSVLRSTLHETPKSQLSPGIYDDTNARRTPVNYQSPMSRSSPMMNRVSEGMSFLSTVRQKVLLF